MTKILMPKPLLYGLLIILRCLLTKLVFLQPASVEVQSIADGEAGVDIQGYDPVLNGQITRAELDRLRGG